KEPNCNGILFEIPLSSFTNGLKNCLTFATAVLTLEQPLATMLSIAPAERALKRIPLSAPHMGGNEVKYVLDAFESNWLSTVGPNLDALEREFSDLVGLPAVALGSGTAAIHLGLKLLRIRPGDEVITPTLTFVASCNPILYERAVPIFI